MPHEQHNWGGDRRRPRNENQQDGLIGNRAVVTKHNGCHPHTMTTLREQPNGVTRTVMTHVWVAWRGVGGGGRMS